MTCPYCLDTKEIIQDSCDHNGEHVQEIYPCPECAEAKDEEFDERI